MKDLPSVSAFAIDKKLNNYQETFHSDERSSNNRKDVINKINDIFSSSNHVYKSRVRIRTKNDILEKYVVGKTQGEILTLSGDKIKIVDIIDIERI